MHFDFCSGKTMHFDLWIKIMQKNQFSQQKNRKIMHYFRKLCRFFFLSQNLSTDRSAICLSKSG